MAEARHQVGEALNLTREETARLGHVADDLQRTTLSVPASGVFEIDVELSAWAVMAIMQAESNEGNRPV